MRLEALQPVAAPADWEARERALQQRLAELQVASHRQGQRAVILIEGWDAAGKGGLIKRMTAELDPRFCEVVPIAAPSVQEKGQHWLQRFWKWLPEAGDWTLFDRSWYGRVAVERIERFARKAEWQRAYGEIEAFERMLVDDGIRLVKLFLHISQAEQDRRFIDRLETPWKRWKMGPEDFRNRAQRDAYLEAYEEMFERTDFAFAPWHLVPAESKRAARCAGMAHVVARLEEGLDMTPPPLDPALRAQAEAALGVKLRPR